MASGASGADDSPHPLRGRTVLGVRMNQSVPIVPLAPLALRLTCSTRSCCPAVARVVRVGACREWRRRRERCQQCQRRERRLARVARTTLISPPPPVRSQCAVAINKSFAGMPCNMLKLVHSALHMQIGSRRRVPMLLTGFRSLLSAPESSCRQYHGRVSSVLTLS